jgi:hypothetical protein
MSRSAPQRHQHGVNKHLVEGIGGVLVGAALVLLLRGLVKRRAAHTPATTPATSGETA